MTKLLFLIFAASILLGSCQGPQGVSRYKHPEEKEKPGEPAQKGRFETPDSGEKAAGNEEKTEKPSRFSDLESPASDPLMTFVMAWKGTPYRYGAMAKTGTDCSGFMKNLFSAVYGINLPRTSKDQFKEGKEISKDNLKKGDLVFFKLSRSRSVSHVGVYIGNNQFAHASIQVGVTIDDLDQAYYKKSYVGARRLVP
ncbi:MAG: C40 family peptidase [Bacteroidetes bacterium]|nr:C40 family peptidase [Bacteroidota bacterium]